MKQKDLGKLLDPNTGHRVYRVPGFLSSRPNWLPRSPLPQASVALVPLWFQEGGDTPAGGRGAGGSQFGRRKDRHSVSGTLSI
jgi:hypothetical protein